VKEKYVLKNCRAAFLEVKTASLEIPDSESSSSTPEHLGSRQQKYILLI